VNLSTIQLNEATTPAFFLLLLLGYMIFIVYPYWRILGRLGYGLFGSILWLIGFALAPWLVVWFFAFAQWPALRDAERSRPPG